MEDVLGDRFGFTAQEDSEDLRSLELDEVILGL